MRRLSFLTVLLSLAALLPRCAEGQRSGRSASASRVDTISFETREGTRLAIDVAPDGDVIVMDLLGQLWSIPVDGGTARGITDAVRDTASDSDPVFSPNGRWIAFRSDRPDGKALWLLDRQSHELRRLTPPLKGFDDVRSPEWSPDSRRLLFQLGDTLRVVDVATGGIHSVPIAAVRTPGVRDAIWSADGARILFVNASPFSRAGGRLLQVSSDGGEAGAVGDSTRQLFAPTPSPDGAALAWLARDSAGRAQLWVQDGAGGAARRLTNQADIAVTRPRWMPGGRELLYSGDGRLWRVRREGGSAREVAFTARVTIPRRVFDTRHLRLARPESGQRARGFLGLAIAPDGKRVALLALGKLWLAPTDGGRPRSVTAVPPTASGMSWSPDGASVAWSAGSGGAEDLFITDVGSGRTRQLTALPGREERASWSPDGRRIAFLHWPAPPSDTAPWAFNAWSIRLRVVDVEAGRDRAPIRNLASTRDLGALEGFDWPFGTVTPLGHEVPQWSPSGDALLRFGTSPIDTTAVLVALDGTRRAIPRFPRAATFVQWGSDSTLVFVRDNRLWRTRLDPTQGAGEAPELLDEPALYASRARDGSIAYLSSEGLRVRSTDARVRRLGWPIELQPPATPTPLVVRNVRVVPGTGAAPAGLSDVYVERGRIARLVPAGSRVRPGSRVIDAGGRTVIPGLIELHGHVWDDARLPAALAVGTTTFRDMGSAAARTAGLRDAIDAGIFEGPRVVVGGFQFNPFIEDGVLSSPVIQGPSDPAGMDRALALADALGADYAKMRIPVGVAAGVRFVAAAHRRGMRVSSHCALALPLVAAGIDGKEHLGPACDERHNGPVYDDVAQLLRASGEWVVPTLAAFAQVPLVAADTTILTSADSAFSVSPLMRWWSLRLPPRSAPTYARYADDARRATTTLFKAGVTIGAGSDVPVAHLGLPLELEQLVAAGLSPLEALTAATATAARILGTDDVGTIRPGALADLVILDGDPLADIRNVRRIWTVIKGGRVVERDRLRAVAAGR